MTKYTCAVIVVALATVLAVPAMARAADKDPGGPSISDFKAQSLFRGVKLKWNVKTPFKKEVAFQLLRSDSFAEGPYQAIGTLPYSKDKGEYTYLDKSMPSESKYFYKLVVVGTAESYGPVSARPFFSPPGT